MVALSNIRCTAHGQHFTVSCKRVPLWKFGGEYFFFLGILIQFLFFSLKGSIEILPRRLNEIA